MIARPPPSSFPVPAIGADQARLAVASPLQMLKPPPPLRRAQRWQKSQLCSTARSRLLLDFRRPHRFSAIPVSKEVFFIFDKLLFDLRPASRSATMASGDVGGFR
ncbi:hypothetical protein JCGZ_19584 [Jatropha curcas]|uniref:Uncharacterized protein n=1 Tax=Jatropha curcas TaxID=180498 RepID=A0A067K6Y1_JATCU|nr:hypothetical protein JCGZ_19584 [Jatropha curcas]